MKPFDHFQNETMKTKKIRLEQARKAVDFINAIDEVSGWMTEAEEILRNDDFGKDVETAKSMLKRQSSLEAELYLQEAKLNNMKESCGQFEKENHFAILMLVKFLFWSKFYLYGAISMELLRIPFR